ncbi:10321_t:CDS:2 [Ambispora leptoticha]|uniref:10321_t:CDS:1 n=1 Tax=Ambispora leptoticha TaxID=144679 RepID=A0A9N9A101_9GLOM|nr:10321_t:CDS:2 [Ambispora leptoticha]
MHIFTTCLEFNSFLAGVTVITLSILNLTRILIESPLPSSQSPSESTSESIPTFERYYWLSFEILSGLYTSLIATFLLMTGQRFYEKSKRRNFLFKFTFLSVVAMIIIHSLFTTLLLNSDEGTRARPNFRAYIIQVLLGMLVSMMGFFYAFTPVLRSLHRVNASNNTTNIVTIIMNKTTQSPPLSPRPLHYYQTETGRHSSIITANRHNNNRYSNNSNNRHSNNRANTIINSRNRSNSNISNSSTTTSRYLNPQNAAVGIWYMSTIGVLALLFATFYSIIFGLDKDRLPYLPTCNAIDFLLRTGVLMVYGVPPSKRVLAMLMGQMVDVDEIIESDFDDEFDEEQAINGTDGGDREIGK